MTIINIPFFPGFYESILSQALDHAQESEIEYNDERESEWPEEMRLIGWQYGELLSDYTDYRAAYEVMARDWCESFDEWMADNLDTPPGAFTFESMSSPRYYNFETDRVFCTVPLAVMESMLANIDREKLARVIESRHKSRDGFISYYRCDIDSWLEKPLHEWDHNELGTLLVAAIVSAGYELDSEWEWNICESILERDYEYLNQNCDWSELKSKVREARIEKLARLMESDPDLVARYVAAHGRVAELLPDALAECDSDTQQAWQELQDSRPYRCPHTPDMFQSQESA